MGLPSLYLGRRPVHGRVLVLYRVDPSVAAQSLPAGMRPHLVGGVAVGTVCYTRLGSLRSRFLPRPRQGADSDHLAYRFAVDVQDAAGPHVASWVVRRETSSRLAARWNSVGRRSRFSLVEDAARIELRVENAEGEELYLRAQVGDRGAGSLFATARAVEAFLDECADVRPHDALDADRVDTRSMAAEALAVSEVRSVYFGDERRFPRGTIELDSAWRLVARRVEPVRARAGFGLRQGESSPAMS